MTFDFQSDGSPEMDLWLRVTLEAISDLLQYNNKTAKQFLFEGNIFFESVCLHLGHEPKFIRERIRRLQGGRQSSYRNR